MSSKDTDVYRSLQSLVVWTSEKVEKSQMLSYILKLTVFLTPCANNHYLLIIALPLLLIVLVLGGITLFELCYIYSTRYSLQQVILNSNAANLQPSELHIPRSLLGMQRTTGFSTKNSDTSNGSSQLQTMLMMSSSTSSKSSSSSLIIDNNNNANTEHQVASSSSLFAKLARSDHMLLANNVQMSSLVLSHYFEIDHVAQKFEQPLLLWTEMARFGNHIFQYAAAYATAKKTGRIPCISSVSDLLSIFGRIAAMPVSARAFRNRRFPVVAEEKTSVFLPSLVDQVRAQPSNVHLEGYFQSWKYLVGYERDIRMQFSIRDDIISVVDGNIRNLSAQHLHLLQQQRQEKANLAGYDLQTLTSPDNFTHIGVHVRRGDLDTFYFRWRGMRPAPVSYINGALDYYRKRYPSRLFFVCSDDIGWCEGHISTEHNDVVFVRSDSYRQDFALLTLCRHSVITSGSFGWWSAWLAGGDVVYYSGFPAANTSFGNQYSKEDYYPPAWIPMP